MTPREAIERIKARFDKWALDDEDMKAIQTLLPELAESEDEKIRKALLRCCDDWEKGQFGCMAKEDVPAIRTYLEKQKEQKSTELPKSEDYGIDGLYRAVDILQKTLGEVDGYQTDDGILEHKCAISAVKELYNQQPAEWSEEDEGMLNCIIATLCEESHGGREANDKMVTWLENRLKSLRPQPHWEPSKEQMEALLKLEETYVLEHEITQETANLYMVIKSLKEQLLKLRKGEL